MSTARHVATAILTTGLFAPPRVILPAADVAVVPSARDVVADGVAALGGADAVRAVRTLRLHYVREAANKGQEDWPGAPVPWFPPSDVIEIDDYANSAVSSERAFARDPRPPITWIVRGDLGLVRRDTARFGVPSASFADPVKRRLRLLPPFLMQQILAAGPTAIRPLATRRLRQQPVDGVEARLAGDTVQLWFDANRHTLAAMSYTIDDPIRGATEVLTEYANWTRVGDVMLPFTTHVSENGTPMEMETMLTADVNPSAVDSTLVVPATNRMREVRNTITFVELAPGLVRLEHPTHTPMAVVQGDSLILLEAPVGDAYMRVVLDSLRAHFPANPVRAFVVTHHHWDHTSGVRAAFAAGLPAIVQAANVDFIRSIGGVDRASAKSRRITSVGDSLVVGTGATRFTLYTIRTGHARGLMMAYFPEPRLMFEVDLAQGSPNDRQDFYDFVTGHHLTVEKIARIHGPVMAWDAFVKTVPVTQ